MNVSYRARALEDVHAIYEWWPMTDLRYTIFFVIDSKAEAIDVLRIMVARLVRDLKRVLQ
jgi:hypothetical protein